MSEVADSDAAGLPATLSALDLLMHAGEANPRTRSGFMVVQLLDRTPPWERFRAIMDNASRQVLRLRQKVVVPTLPTASARWVVDPDFNLDFHVRRVRVAEPATLREVFDLAELSLQSPLDIARPLWTATLAEGLDDGRAAVLLHLSHAVADGLGLIEMLFAQICDLERDPPPRPRAQMPIPEDLSAVELMRAGINRLPAVIVGGARGLLSGAVGVAARVVRDPVSAVGDVLGYALSGGRVVGSVAEPSPLLRGRSLATRSEAIEMSLDALRAAAKAGGGSVNDAYLAAVCAALRVYHDELGVPVETLPMAVPVNIRSAADPGGGNRFAGVNLAAPIGTADPAERIAGIREQMSRRRDERAIDVLSVVAPVLTLLPGAILESMAGSFVGSDVQASNVPMYQGDVFLGGAKVLRQYSVGPLPGVAMMVVLVSLSGRVTVTVRYDRAAVTDEPRFARCLLAGFDEVLALGGDERAQAASFTAAVPDAPVRDGRSAT